VLVPAQRQAIQWIREQMQVQAQVSASLLAYADGLVDDDADFACRGAARARLRKVKLRGEPAPTGH
jgi:hypothetical protein